jgi:hypothetical protein
MQLEIIEQHPLRCLQYLERYVNDGSPSGFTEKNRTSTSTDPFGLTPWYHPFCLLADPDSIEVFGYVPDLLPMETDIGTNWFVIHPDMVEHPELSQLKIQQLDNLKVLPTSSGRTVQILGHSSDYIKLHYDGIIGRINRKLTRAKAISGPEISQHVLEAINKKKLPEQFCILHETGAKILSVNKGTLNSSEWGLVWREGQPRGPNAHHITFLVPLFSLWSTDRLRPYDPTLLERICGKGKEHLASYLIEKLLFPILDAYFGLILTLGFQVEFNAQNLLIGFDINWEPIAIVLRDMMGTEKDLSLRSKLGLPLAFESAPYKFLIEEDDPDLYRIRHSFVFDFKVAKYVLDPIIEHAYLLGYLTEVEAITALRERSKGWLAKLPEDFFPPQQVWYRHDRVLLDQKREYISVANPRYR